MAKKEKNPTKTKEEKQIIEVEMTIDLYGSLNNWETVLQEASTIVQEYTEELDDKDWIISQLDNLQYFLRRNFINAVDTKNCLRCNSPLTLDDSGMYRCYPCEEELAKKE